MVLLAGFSLRRSAVGVRGRGEWVSHLHDAPLRTGTQRKAGPYGKVPRNRAKNTTLIAAITLEGGMGESMAIEGATTDAEVFEAYVEHFLAPSLKEGQVVVVLDRLGAHRTQRVTELIEAREAAQLFCSCRPTRRI